MRQIFFSCAMFLCAVSPSFSAESDKIIVYFYSSETNINNFKSLKTEFDAYLIGFGHYEFQPFSDRETFENHIRDKKKYLLLLSGWYFGNIRKEYSLTPLLVGVREGKTSQKRILVGAVGASSSAESVKTGQIASASSLWHTRSVLKEIYGEAADSMQILPVPKDIDALMSVGFGISRYALAAESSLETLKSLNSQIHKNMTIIAESELSSLPIISSPEAYAKDTEKILKVIENMQTNPDGKNKLKMLGLDGWEKIDRLKTPESDG